MLTTKVEVKVSSIHGMGIFAIASIPKGTVVWVFNPHTDTRVRIDDASEEQMHFGYVNPARPDELVVCGDDSKWWNFAHEANCGELFRPTFHCEAAIVALRDIRAGDELTITTSSDADAENKLNQ